MVVYMAVTADKYELPIAIADKCIDLANILGVRADCVSKAIYVKSTGKRWGFMIKKVEIDENE